MRPAGAHFRPPGATSILSSSGGSTRDGRFWRLVQGREHITRAHQCPVLGVKRTWRLHCEMSANDPNRTLPLPALSFVPIWCPTLRDSGAGSETARVHQASWRNGGLAARGKRARPTGTTHRHTHSPGRDGKQSPYRSVVAGAAATGLDRGPQRPHRHARGRRECRRSTQICDGAGRVDAGRPRCFWQRPYGPSASVYPHCAHRVHNHHGSTGLWFCQQPRAAKWQRHRLHVVRI